MDPETPIDPDGQTIQTTPDYPILEIQHGSVRRINFDQLLRTKADGPDPNGEYQAFRIARRLLEHGSVSEQEINAKYRTDHPGSLEKQVDKRRHLNTRGDLEAERNNQFLGSYRLPGQFQYSRDSEGRIVVQSPDQSDWRITLQERSFEGNIDVQLRHRGSVVKTRQCSGTDEAFQTAVFDYADSIYYDRIESPDNEKSASTASSPFAVQPEV